MSQLVAAGTLDVTSVHTTDVNIAFLLDTLELLTVRRRVRDIQARLRSGATLDAHERRELAIQATRDAARQRELASRLEGVADPFAEDLAGKIPAAAVPAETADPASGDDGDA